MGREGIYPVNGGSLPAVYALEVIKARHGTLDACLAMDGFEARHFTALMYSIFWGVVRERLESVSEDEKGDGGGKEADHSLRTMGFLQRSPPCLLLNHCHQRSHQPDRSNVRALRVFVGSEMGEARTCVPRHATAASWRKLIFMAGELGATVCKN